MRERGDKEEHKERKAGGMKEERKEKREGRCEGCKSNILSADVHAVNETRRDHGLKVECSV